LDGLIGWCFGGILANRKQQRTINENLAQSGIIEARQQLRHGGFSGTGTSHQSHLRRGGES